MRRISHLWQKRNEEGVFNQSKPLIGKNVTQQGLLWKICNAKGGSRNINVSSSRGKGKLSQPIRTLLRTKYNQTRCRGILPPTCSDNCYYPHGENEWFPSLAKLLHKPSCWIFLYSNRILTVQTICHGHRFLSFRFRYVQRDTKTKPFGDRKQKIKTFPKTENTKRM